MEILALTCNFHRNSSGMFYTN